MVKKKSTRSRKTTRAPRVPNEPAPLTAAKLRRRKALRPTKKAPRVEVSLATFRLPRGVRPAIQKVRGKANTYQVRFVAPE